MLTTLLLATTSILMPNDSAQDHHDLGEVVVVAERAEGSRRSAKGSVASIDENLQELSHIDLIRRGSYASEAIVNNMSTERLSTTIDGMKIFYACTDKMDPVTSYVESGNLQSISLNTGLEGNPQSTGNIGGSLDLKLRRVGFDNDPFHLNFSAGHEWNGHVQVYGSDVALSNHRFYSNFGIFYRHAGNYQAGGNEEIAFSQFQKVNAFANFGFRLAEQDVLESTFIFDRATNVGYPALNMDVDKAEGLITSLSYLHTFNHQLAQSWETKLYYNHITHIMDDTHRPDVQIHMDMPGHSHTAGLYSLLRLSNNLHNATINYDLYYNRRKADMTMYPGGAAPMYMLTWPDVGTLNTGFALNDVLSLSHHQSISLSGKVAEQWQQINSKEGYDALKVFFPLMKQSYAQFIGRIAATYTWQPSHWSLSAGAGWGSRAPSITEAYGYYLNNTFDKYDYIGNPYLSNESAIELHATVKWNPLRHNDNNWDFTIYADADAFFFNNYIVGKFESRISHMTVGAQGVKVYTNLSNARIINTSINTRLQFPRISTDGALWSWNGKLTFASGTDDEHDNLPFISPFGYLTALHIDYHRFSAQAQLKGNARQNHFAEKYGETVTPAYAIINLSAQYRLKVQHVSSLILRAGVENLLDKRYTTYSDWNKIPQKGRNIYLSLSLGL